MKVERLDRGGRDFISNVAEIAEKARDLSAKVKEHLDNTYNDLGKGVRRVKTAADDSIDDLRDRVRTRPLAAVSSVAAGAFAIGLLTGFLLGRRER